MFADIVVLVHLVWIMFLIAGAYWGRRFRTVRIVHLAGLGFAIVSQVFGWYCPLTHLEVWLREHQGLAAYPGSFIAHYAEKLVYIEIPPVVVFILTIGLIGIQVLIYMTTFKESGNLQSGSFAGHSEAKR